MAENKHDNLIIAAAVLAVAYFGIIKPVGGAVKDVTDKLGITTSEKERREASLIAEVQKNIGWRSELYTNPARFIPIGAKYMTLKPSTAKAAVAKIAAAWGVVNDDEQAIYAVFRDLASQIQLSQICYEYKIKYNKDLLTRLQTPWHYFQDGLSEKEFAVIAAMVKELPLYTSK